MLLPKSIVSEDHAGISIGKGHCVIVTKFDGEVNSYCDRRQYI